MVSYSRTHNLRVSKITGEPMSNKILYGIPIFIFVLIIGIYISVYHKIPVLNSLVPRQYSEIVKQARLERKPIVFFVYATSEEKSLFNQLTKNEAVKKRLSMVLSEYVKSPYFKNTFSDLFRHTQTAILITDFKGDKCGFIKGIPAEQDFMNALDEALKKNDDLNRLERTAKKEFYKIKAVYDSKKFIMAMEKFHKYLYIYSDSDYASKARSLLHECSRKPEVTDYLAHNRDVTNRKVLLHEAEKNFQYHRFFQAGRMLDTIIKTFPDSEEAVQAKEIKNKIEQFGREHFQAANKLYSQKKFHEAKEAYLSLHEKFKGTHWDLFIAGKLKELEVDKEYLAFMEQEKINRRTKSIFKKAERHFSLKHWEVAKMYYLEIVKYYPSCQYVDQSKNRIDEIEQIQYQKLYGDKSEQKTEE